MITNSQAVQFAQKLRSFADRSVQLHDAAMVLLNYWNANGGAGILPPATVTPTALATGGTLTAGLKSYKVSALNARGETLASAAATATTTGSTGSVSLAFGLVTGATSYNVYGRTAGAELRIANVTASPFVDTGSVTPSGAQPVTNLTGLIPNDAEVVNDGSPADLRGDITGAQCNLIVNRMIDFKNLMEGSVGVASSDGSKAMLNTLLVAAVNLSSGI